jgi:hypothetical protein
MTQIQFRIGQVLLSESRQGRTSNSFPFAIEAILPIGAHGCIGAGSLAPCRTYPCSSAFISGQFAVRLAQLGEPPLRSSGS